MNFHRFIDTVQTVSLVIYYSVHPQDQIKLSEQGGERTETKLTNVLTLYIFSQGDQ